MKIPEKHEQIGEVIPIMRSMSPPQKLAMATIISTRISNNDTTFPSLEEAQSLLGDGNQRENASRELMLPISMDIAKIISSEDSDSEESNEEEEDEMPEALPEVSRNVQIKNNANLCDARSRINDLSCLNFLSTTGERTVESRV